MRQCLEDVAMEHAIVLSVDETGIAIAGLTGHEGMDTAWQVRAG